MKKKLIVSLFVVMLLIGLGLMTQAGAKDSAQGETESAESVQAASGLALQVSSVDNLMSGIDASVPDLLQQRARGELEELGDLTYPQGSQLPTFSDLMPLASNASISTVDGQALVLSVPATNPEAARQLRAAGLTSGAQADGLNLVTNPGDIAIYGALDWECAWMSEFARASRASDATRVDAALKQLEGFPKLAVIEKYNPELGAGFASDVLPRLRSGDVGFAQYWLETSCSGMLR